MTIFSKLTSAFKSLPFSGYGGNGYGGGAAYVPGVSLTGSGFPGAGLPGTNYDYKSAAGVLWQNPSAAACFVALTKAFAQSRPVLERREGKAWQQVDEHALLDLLNVPNEFYSGERLFGVTLISTMANGAGYWRIERDRKGDPAELWFEPPTGVGPTGLAPAWDEEHFIREYFYFIDGKRHGEPLPRQDVVYFRHGLNPANTREPWAPLSLAAREIATLNSASTYTGALLRNSAVPSGMVTLEGSSLASGTPPTPEQAEEMKRRIKAGFKGDQVGEPFVSSLPWKWTPFNWSPEQLNISKLQTWPQGMVCALLGTPEIVALLPTGEQPTYQNLAASMEWWWNNTVIPLEDAFADEIETQLFPAFGLDRHEYRLTWDRSQVPALQEDEIAKHQMVREDYRAGVIDLFTATVQLGGEAVEEMRGVYHPSAVGKSNDGDATKGISRYFRETDWVRDKGMFHSYVGTSGYGVSTLSNNHPPFEIPDGWQPTHTPPANAAEAHARLMAAEQRHDVFGAEQRMDNTRERIEALESEIEKVPKENVAKLQFLNNQYEQAWSTFRAQIDTYDNAVSNMQLEMYNLLNPTANPHLIQPDSSGFSLQENETVLQTCREISAILHRTDLKKISIFIAKDKDTQYDPNSRVIHWNPAEGKTALIHEFGHVIDDHSPQTGQRAIELLLRRTKGYRPRPLKELKNTNKTETGYYLPDHFHDPVVGKLKLRLGMEPTQPFTAADITGTEITAYALHMLLSAPHELARADAEHFEFIYNVLGGHQ